MSALQRTIALFTILLTCSQTGLASDLGKTLVMRGNDQGATACVACHGADGGGQAQSGFPRLAGLNAAYLEKQLHDFANASRDNPIMAPIARAMSATEIKAVASYLSKMSPPTYTANESNASTAGKQLAENGHWSNDIPACFTCHGPGGNGVGTHFPALAGQHASYIKQQLLAWRSGQRHNDPNDLMKGVAQRLSLTEIDAISSYLANLAATAH